MTRKSSLLQLFLHNLNLPAYEVRMLISAFPVNCLLPGTKWLNVLYSPAELQDDKNAEHLFQAMNFPTQIWIAQKQNVCCAFSSGEIPKILLLRFCKSR